MNEPSGKLQHRAREHTAEDANLAARNEKSAREFASVEELIRHDAAQTEVPAAVTQRLQKSAAGTSSPRKPWWRRMLGQ
jgi:anti-sigma-K factor RskA